MIYVIKGNPIQEPPMSFQVPHRARSGVLDLILIKLESGTSACKFKIVHHLKMIDEISFQTIVKVSTRKPSTSSKSPNIFLQNLFWNQSSAGLSLFVVFVNLFPSQTFLHIKSWLTTLSGIKQYQHSLSM